MGVCKMIVAKLLLLKSCLRARTISLILRFLCQVTLVALDLLLHGCKNVEDNKDKNDDTEPKIDDTELKDEQDYKEMTYTRSSKLQCTPCKTYFLSSEYLTQRLATGHNKSLHKVKTETAEEKQNYNCSKCGQNFISLEKLAEHKNDIHVKSNISMEDELKKHFETFNYGNST